MRKMFLLCFVFATMSLGAACPHGPVYNPTPTPPTPVDTDDCALACQAMRSHNCIEGTDIPTPDSGKITCEEFCRVEQQDNGVELNPSCVKTITSCDEIEGRCGVGKLRN